MEEESTVVIPTIGVEAYKMYNDHIVIIRTWTYGSLHNHIVMSVEVSNMRPTC